MMGALGGVVMELQDCALTLLKGISLNACPAHYAAVHPVVGAVPSLPSVCTLTFVYGCIAEKLHCMVKVHSLEYGLTHNVCMLGLITIISVMSGCPLHCEV